MTDATVPRLLARDLRSPLAGPYDFEIAPGACAVIGGPSGSGKSLFLRMLADLDPNTGDVRLDGRSRAGMSGPQWRRLVPYVQSEAGWWSDHVVDHFAPERWDAGRALAQQLGLTADQFEGPVARLSTGERQRLALVRGLVLDSTILLLDEPTSALDGADVLRVETILKARLAKGDTLVVVSHDPGQAQRLSAKRYLMTDRRLSAVETAHVG